MKHEAEILPAEVIPSQIITDVVFTPDPELNAGIDAAILHQKRSDAAKRGWVRKRELYGSSGIGGGGYSCCTAHRSRFMHGYY